MGSSRLSARILVAATLALLAVTPLFAVLNVRPTEAQLGPGGRNFSITNLGGRQVRLSWSSGVAASYVLEQIGQRSGAVGSFLPGSATSTEISVSFFDSFACYELLALDANAAILARSDIVCIIFGFSTGVGPANFTVGLNQGTVAGLSWDGLPGAGGYLVVPLGTQRLQNLGAGTQSATDNTGGALTCYGLVATSATGAAIGIDEVLCAWPGFAQFPSTVTATSTPTRSPTSAVLAQQPYFSVGPNGASGCDPADILAIPGTTGIPCGGTGSPDVLIRCSALTFAESCAGSGGAGPQANDDVRGLSFGEAIGDPAIYFGVTGSSQGCPNSGVRTEAAFSAGDDEYVVIPGGSQGCVGNNAIYVTGESLGIKDGDELDDFSWPSTAPGVGTQPYFTLAPGSPSLARIPAVASDILTRASGSGAPTIAVNHSALGLQSGDAIDAMCMFSPPSVGGVSFSLAPGSPSLTAFGFSSADLLVAGPVLATSASQLGLLTIDDVDGLKCRQPVSSATFTPTLTPTITPTITLTTITITPTPTYTSTTTSTITRTVTITPTLTPTPTSTTGVPPIPTPTPTPTSGTITGISATFTTTGNTMVLTFVVAGAVINDFEVASVDNPTFPTPLSFTGPDTPSWGETFTTVPGGGFLFHACTGQGSNCVNSSAHINNGDQFTLVLNGPYNGCSLLIWLTQNGNRVAAITATRPGC